MSRGSTVSILAEQDAIFSSSLSISLHPRHDRLAYCLPLHRLEFVKSISARHYPHGE